MEPIILVGGGGHCRSCIDVIEQEGRFEIVGIVDMPEEIGTSLLGYPVIGSDDDLTQLTEKHRYFFLTLGQIKTPQRRIEIYRQLQQLGADLPTIVSPRAYISRHAEVGGGTIVMHNVIVNAGAKVGENCILNSRALIEHDASIGNCCHISTGAIVNGGTQVADGTFVGSGAVIRDNTRVGSYSLIGGGVSVMEEVPDKTIYTGKK